MTVKCGRMNRDEENKGSGLGLWAHENKVRNIEIADRRKTSNVWQLDHEPFQIGMGTVESMHIVCRGQKKY